MSALQAHLEQKVGAACLDAIDLSAKDELVDGCILNCQICQKSVIKGRVFKY